VAEVLRRHGLARGRLVVGHEQGEDRMTFRVERPASADEALARAIEATLRDLVKVRGDVDFVAPGSLPNDGKVIDDVRIYS
jgi:phenylacetate-CoA ligase